MVRLLVVVAGLAAIGCAGFGSGELAQCSDEALARWEIPAEWYSRSLTMEQARQVVLNGSIPRDEIRGRWQAMEGQVQPGDRLWLFVRPPQSLVHDVAGEEGVVLNRGCRQLAHVTTSLRFPTGPE